MLAAILLAFTNVVTVAAPGVRAAGDGWAYAAGAPTTANGQASTGDHLPALVFAFAVGQTVTACSSPAGSCSIGQPDGAMSFEIFAQSATVTVTFTVTTAAPIACGNGLGFKVSYTGSLPYILQDPVPSNNSCEPPPEACPVSNVKGRMQPVQAVWQDDEIFRDKKVDNNQLLGSSPSTTDALLPMVQGKPTALFGVEKVRREAARSGIHDQITIEGDTTGTKDVGVRMEFSSPETSPTTIETTDLLATLKLDGPCGAPQHFVVSLPFSDGVPLAGDPFTFPNTGTFTIKDELIRATGEPTGIVISVFGGVVATKGPTVAFVPIILSSATAQDRQKLNDRAAQRAVDSHDMIPDLFPLVPGALPTWASGLLDFSSARSAAAKNYEQWLTTHSFSLASFQDVRTQATLAAISTWMGFGPGQARKAQRVIVLVRDRDLQLLAGKGAAAFTPSQKVTFMGWLEDWDTVSHELAHTMPYLWSATQMKSQCNYNYHNLTKTLMANGEQLTRAGAVSRNNRDGSFSIMEADGLPPQEWIDQCTYRDLAKVLQNPPDPAAILVEGRLASAGGRSIGQLFPLYQLQATTDLTAGSGGTHAIVLRDASGRQLARYGFTPTWGVEDAGFTRGVMSFAYRVPAVAGAARVDLVGPGGTLLDSRTYSRHAPTVTITSPVKGTTITVTNGRVHVTWQGVDADHDTLHYSVVYSPDGGDSWMTESLETTATAMDIALQPGATNQVVRVYATDGSRSGQAEVRFIAP